MASLEKQRPQRRSWSRWKRNTLRFQRLCCCLCIRCNRKPLQEQKKKTDESLLHQDEQKLDEKEIIQITVEDLGIDNGSFSLLDEDSLTLSSGVVRSGSSVSAYPRALKKKQHLKPLSSLPIQPQVHLPSTPSDGDDKEQEEEYYLMFESSTDSTPASEGHLTPPTINLIPPTPSDFVEDDQFFDNNYYEDLANSPELDGNFPEYDQKACQEKLQRGTENGSKEGFRMAEKNIDTENGEGEIVEFEGHIKTSSIKHVDKKKTKVKFSWSNYNVAPLDQNPRKTEFSTGKNHLSFSEHNLDADNPRTSDCSCADMLKAELSLLPNRRTMDTIDHKKIKRPLTRSCSLVDTTSRSSTFLSMTQTTQQCQEGSPRQRRKTVASFLPQTTDRNGNFTEKEAEQQEFKPLTEMNTDEVCEWFNSIGLKKCLPFIREEKLCGSHIASVDKKTLETLHIITLEEREQLLSAIYDELHPPTPMIDTLDTLIGPNNLEVLTETSPMTKSQSSPQMGRFSMNRCSLKLRSNNQNNTMQKNSQMIEVAINTSERIIHLRTPRETTVGKIINLCVKMLGMTDDKSLFMIKEKQDSPEQLPIDQQIGTLLTSNPESQHLELHLCKMDKVTSSVSQSSPEIKGQNGYANEKVQGNPHVKEERIKELNQQVDSLQNVVLQIQELHHDLVAFCSELKSMDTDFGLDTIGSAELEKRMDLVNSTLNDKKLNLRTLRDSISNFAAHKKKQLEVRLLEKMKLNCQVFKEEISIVHLNRQAAHLQNALQENCVKDKIKKETLAVSSLSQLVSPESPAILMVVQETQNANGHFGFTCHLSKSGGLEVVKVDRSHLCVGDRLVEVNGANVLNSTLDELSELLKQGSRAQIVVLRRPSSSLSSPLVLQHTLSPVQTVPGRSFITKETPPQQKVIAI